MTRPEKLIATVRANSSGLTLFELLVVLTMIGVLGAIAVPSAVDYLNKGQRAKAFADIHDLQSRLLQYHENAGQYPDSLDAVSWSGRDPWANPYQYLKIEGEPN